MEAAVSKLLYIEASPVKSASHSITVARTFLESYQRTHPQDTIEAIDLWETELPPFDARTIEAKFAVLRRKQFTDEQLARWESLRQLSRQFNAADKYVFSVPMWNFGIPYPMKHYIDVVTLPGENWIWSKERGYEPLRSGKKALLIYSSANDYALDALAGSDFQKPYMRRWLRFIGIYDVHEITVAPVLAEPEVVAEVRAQVDREAAQLAVTF